MHECPECGELCDCDFDFEGPFDPDLQCICPCGENWPDDDEDDWEEEDE